MSDKVVVKLLALQELAVGRQVLVVGRAQESCRALVEAPDLPEHLQEPRVDEAPWLGECAAKPPAAGILQRAALAADAQAHLGATHLDL